MTAPKETAVADAIAAALAAEGYTAPRLWLATYSLSETDLDALVVTVIVNDVEYEQIGRDITNNLYTIDLIAQQKLTEEQAGLDAEVDDRLGDVEAIADLWNDDGALRKTTMAGALWREIERPAYLDREHLQKGLFTSVLRLTYAYTQ